MRKAIARRYRAAETLRVAERSWRGGGKFTPTLDFKLYAAAGNEDPTLRQAMWAASFPLTLAAQGISRISVSGPESLRTWDHARAIFGHHIKMHFEPDARESLLECVERTGTISVLGWMTQPGAGLWWPILNEGRFQSLRIVAGWPVNGELDPATAIIANGELPRATDGASLLICHDDLYRAERQFAEVGITVRELGRARSLVLFKADMPANESDPRLTRLRRAGLDGLKLVGALPAG